MRLKKMLEISMKYIVIDFKDYEKIDNALEETFKKLSYHYYYDHGKQSWVLFKEAEDGEEDS